MISRSSTSRARSRARPIIPRLESFTTGVLATILATPCSGPFLGGVLAWALIQPPDIIALVLSCIGLGMASPYLAMALFPGLYRLLPNPEPGPCTWNASSAFSWPRPASISSACSRPRNT
jgi:thiol:disulfide interchange protein